MIFKKKILSTFSDLKELESDIEWFMKVNRVPGSEVYDIKMAIHEYILNVMEHGYHWNQDKEIIVEVSIEKSDNNLIINIAIQDFAPKFEISKEKILKSVNNRSFRGRGLLMIMTFIDEIIYDSSFEEGNRVIMKKSLKIAS